MGIISLFMVAVALFRNRHKLGYIALGEAGILGRTFKGKEISIAWEHITQVTIEKIQQTYVLATATIEAPDVKIVIDRRFPQHGVLISRLRSICEDKNITLIENYNADS